MHLQYRTDTLDQPDIYHTRNLLSSYGNQYTSRLDTHLMPHWGAKNQLDSNTQHYTSLLVGLKLVTGKRNLIYMVDSWLQILALLMDCMYQVNKVLAMLLPLNSNILLGMFCKHLDLQLKEIVQI